MEQKKDDNELRVAVIYITINAAAVTAVINFLVSNSWLRFVG